MDVDSIKRLLVLLAGTGVMYFGHKFGVGDATLYSVAGLFATYLAQSGAKAIAGLIAQNKGAASVFGELGKIKAAYDQAQAQAALNAAKSAGAAPGNASNG